LWRGGGGGFGFDTDAFGGEFAAAGLDGCASGVEGLRGRFGGRLRERLRGSLCGC
jgi:hypothetical protein